MSIPGRKNNEKTAIIIKILTHHFYLFLIHIVRQITLDYISHGVRNKQSVERAPVTIVKMVAIASDNNSGINRP